MTLTAPRTLGYYARSAWFQGAIYLLLAVLLGARLLVALNEAQERAEKLAVELTVRNMRTGMQLAMGEALMHRREGEIASWVGSNPVRWLGAPPDGYLGECSGAEARALPVGRWCFDRERHELVYRPRNADHLRIFSQIDGRQAEHLRWRVAGSPDKNFRGGFIGLHVEIVTLHKWFLD